MIVMSKQSSCQHYAPTTHFLGSLWLKKSVEVIILVIAGVLIHQNAQKCYIFNILSCIINRGSAHLVEVGNNWVHQ